MNKPLSEKELLQALTWVRDEMDLCHNIVVEKRHGPVTLEEALDAMAFDRVHTRLLERLKDEYGYTES